MGQYALQLLKYYGYTNVLATASSKHHATLQNLGATKLVDYKDDNAVEEIVKAGGHGQIRWILDCIGSVEGSMKPVSRIANAGAKVAVLLPFIVRDSSETEDPVYSMDTGVVEWERGVEVMGVRTHFYAKVCGNHPED